MQTVSKPSPNVIRRTLRNVTPSRLKLLIVATSILTVLFCSFTLSTIKQHDHAMQTIGVEAGPSVIAAHQIKIGILSMDADLADELLFAPGEKNAQEMTDHFTKNRLETSKNLVRAARNITYGNAEAVPIENIQMGFGRFLMQAQSARDVQARANESDSVKSYRMALQTIQEVILPNIDALDKANADVLDEVYNRERSASALSRGFVLLLGLGVLALLLYTQFYLNMRFRRRLNAPLLVASICTVLFLVHLTQSLASCSNQTKIAKEDAFDSVVALLHARSKSYDANASESRWLLDRERSAIYEKSFFDNIASVAKFDTGHDFKTTQAAAEKQLAAGEKLALPGFTGELADELANVEFEGEAQAATETLHEFGKYVTADKKIRDLENSGDHKSAMQYGLGYSPYGSNYLFAKYDDALDRTLKINQKQLELAFKAGKHDLDNLMAGTIALGLLVIIAVCIGLTPRLDEYSH